MVAVQYHQPMFQDSLRSWTPNEIDLAQWCLFYYNLSSREEKERPPDRIWDKLLEWDIMLDEWLEQERWKKENANRLGIVDKTNAETFSIG